MGCFSQARKLRRIEAMTMPHHYPLKADRQTISQTLRTGPFDKPNC